MAVHPFTNKGQLQILETVVVLFIFFLILFGVLFLYYKYSFGNLEEKGDVFHEQQATFLLDSLSATSEMGCTKEECLDVVKIFALQSQEGQTQFFESLGVQKIVLEHVYPVGQQGICTLESFYQTDFPFTCDQFVVFEHKGIPSTYLVSAPVSLYYAHLDAYHIGRIVIYGL